MTCMKIRGSVVSLSFIFYEKKKKRYDDYTIPPFTASALATNINTLFISRKIHGVSRRALPQPFGEPCLRNISQPLPSGAWGRHPARCYARRGTGSFAGTIRGWNATRRALVTVSVTVGAGVGVRRVQVRLGLRLRVALGLGLGLRLGLWLGSRLGWG